MDLQTIQQAIKQISAEKGLSEESIMETINSALAAAYRKDFGQKNQNIFLEFDIKSGEMKVYDKKVVVDFPEDIIKEIDVNGRDKKFVKDLNAVAGEEVSETESVEQAEPARYSYREHYAEEREDAMEAEGADIIKFNPKNEILLEDAKAIKKGAKVGDELVQDLEVPADFGRMAAQTAKQVIIQKIREAERDSIFNEFKAREKELITGVVQRRDMRGYLIDLGKTAALLPFEEQIKNENYAPGARMKFFLVSVAQTIKGPEVIVSRSTPEIIKRLFETEIPEINSKAIDIMAVAREAGSRTKVAVRSNQENIDPIGSCVGQRGARIQTIINEIGGEKIDIIEWNEDPAKFIAHALSPAKVVGIEVSEKDRTASVMVNEDQLSLAIGREGQNVRLAAKLTGWKINIMKETQEGKKETVLLAGGEGKEGEEGIEVENKVITEEKEEKKPKAKKEKKEKVPKVKKVKKEKKD